MTEKHGLATFVHEGLGWTLADQSLDGSVIEWLCVDADGVKIVNVCKPPTSQMISINQSIFIRVTSKHKHKKYEDKKKKYKTAGRRRVDLPVI